MEGIAEVRPPHDTALATFASRLVAVTLLVLAAYHVLLTISTVSAYTLRYPFMDQFRFNLRYLTMPFPQSVLQLENGHRPILPGLIRVVELTRLGGTQTLQTVTSWLAAALAAAMLLREAHRGLQGNWLLQAAAVCVIGTLLAWNANVRMFIHPFEAVHVFYILFFVVAAARLALRACAASEPLPWIVSMASCVAATFTFAPGIASFAAPMSVAILRRQRFGTIAFIGATAIATLYVYYVVLPGAGGLRGNVSASSAAVFFAVARLGAIYAEVVRLSVSELSILVWIAWSTGALAIALTATTVVSRWMRRRTFSTWKRLVWPYSHSASRRTH